MHSMERGSHARDVLPKQDTSEVRNYVRKFYQDLPATYLRGY